MKRRKSFKLISQRNDVLWAIPCKKPTMKSCFGRCWDYDLLDIDGKEVKFWFDSAWGSWFYFEKDGEWYKVDMLGWYECGEPTALVTT